MTAAHDVSEGGIAVAIAECLFGTDNLGAEVTLTGEETVALFSETQSRFIVSVKKEHEERFEALVGDATKIGGVTNSKQLIIRNENEETVIQTDIKVLEEAWKGAIPCLLNIKA